MITAVLLFISQILNVGTANIGTFSVAPPYASIDVPSTLYALEGQTLSLLFFNVVRFDGPDRTMMTNSATCSKGTATATGWSYTPIAADAGTTTLTINVHYQLLTGGTQLAATKTVTVITKALAYPSTPVSRKVLLIGDSTSAGGYVSAQLTNLFIGDSTYTFANVGSNQGNGTDAGSVSRAIAMDAVSGKTFVWFETDAITAWTQRNGSARIGSPFFNTNTTLFDTSYYLTNWNVSLSSGDWVVFNLGINDTFSSQTSDSATTTAINNCLASFERMRTNIQAMIPGIRIGLALTIPPNQSSAAFIADYGTSPYTLALYQAANHKLVETMISRYDNGQVTGVTLIPINCNIDTVNNMASGVHPAPAGYYQIASTYRAFLKGVE